MKKAVYLISILFAVALLSTSCEKDPVVPELTLEEQYPDWSNLTWVSTDGVSTPDTYPKLEITIVGDEGEIIHTLNSVDYYLNVFTDIIIEGDMITFDKEIGEATGTFTKNGSEITLTTFGLMNENNPANEHTYVLKIN